MHYGSRALGLGSILLLAAQAVAAQQQPKDLPEAPAAKQEADHKHDSSLQATFEVLGRRSVFFPDLAASPGPLSSKQKLELFAGKSSSFCLLESGPGLAARSGKKTERRPKTSKVA